jgi:hypothetical protein
MYASVSLCNISHVATSHSLLVPPWLDASGSRTRTAAGMCLPWLSLLQLAQLPTCALTNSWTSTILNTLTFYVKIMVIATTVERWPSDYKFWICVSHHSQILA